MRESESAKGGGFVGRG